MASYRKLPSGKWQAVVKHPSGKRFTKTDPLKRVVVEWAGEREAEIRRGEFVDPAAGKQTLAEWWEHWSATRAVERATVSKRESLWRVHLQPAFGTWPLASIQSLDVEGWVADMRRRDVGPEAQASSFRLLKQLLGDAVRHKRIRSNPCELVAGPTSPKHVDRFLSIEESDRLLEAITMPSHDRAGVPRSQTAPRVPDEVNRLFVRLMLDAGLRWQEAAGLHGFRIDLMRRRLQVKEVVERGRRVKPIPKSKAGQRIVPLTDDLVALLSEHMAGRPREALLFTEDGAASGRPLDYSNWLKRVWNRALVDAGLEDPQPTPHDCRHSYGSWLGEQGVPATEIRDLMGHSSLRAVERYLHSSEVRLERARQALGARRAHEGVKEVKGPASTKGGNGV